MSEFIVMGCSQGPVRMPVHEGNDALGEVIFEGYNDLYCELIVVDGSQGLVRMLICEGGDALREVIFKGYNTYFLRNHIPMNCMTR